MGIIVSISIGNKNEIIDKYIFGSLNNFLLCLKLIFLLFY